MTPFTQTTQSEKKAFAVSKFAEGCTWREVASAVGVHFTTIWRWGQADPDFALAIKEAGANADAEVEAVTFQNAIDSDPAHNTLRMFWLKSRMPHRYRENVGHDHSGGLKVIVEYADDNSYLAPAAPEPISDPEIE